MSQNMTRDILLPKGRIVFWKEKRRSSSRMIWKSRRLKSRDGKKRPPREVMRFFQQPVCKNGGT
jgi:hypothetical protein